MMGHRLSGSVALVALVGMMGAGGVAQAAQYGAASCNAGERFVTRYRSVQVNAYVPQAQRGDILLTAGGDGVPKAIFNALGQTYNHTMLISQDDGAGGTLITHDTSIAPGMKSIELSLAAGPRWKPDMLRRQIPGNVVGDRAQDLLYGRDTGCLNDHDPQDCLDARPVNLWRTTNLLLRPNPAHMSQTAIINHAEAIPEHALLYAFGAYSDHGAAYSGTGGEAAFGPGTMCSGFVTESVNAALTASGHGSLAATPVTYSNAQRFTAAVALHNKIYGLFGDMFGDAQGNFNFGAFTDLVVNVVTGFTNQIVNCFAHGGACDDKGAWTSVDPVAFKNGQAAPGFGQLYAVQPNSLGTGASLSGEDLMDQALAKGWATAISTNVMGDYSYDVVDHHECCVVDQTGNVTGNCRRISLHTTSPDAQADATLAEDHVQVSPGDEDDVFETIASQDGEFVERDGMYCYATREGELCTELPAETTETTETTAQRDTLAQAETTEARR